MFSSIRTRRHTVCLRVSHPPLVAPLPVVIREWKEFLANCHAASVSCSFALRAYRHATHTRGLITDLSGQVGLGVPSQTAMRCNAFERQLCRPAWVPQPRGADLNEASEPPTRVSADATP